MFFCVCPRFISPVLLLNAFRCLHPKRAGALLGSASARARPAVEHKARLLAVGDEPPRPVDPAEEKGYNHALLLVRVEAAVLGGKLLYRRSGDGGGGIYYYYFALP